MEVQWVWGSEEGNVQAQRGWEAGRLWNIQGRQVEVSAPSKRCKDSSEWGIWDQRKALRRKLINSVVPGDFN